MHLVDNINLVTAFGRCKGYLLAQVTDIIYAGIGRSVNFNYIQRGSLYNALTVAALAAGLGSRPLLAVQAARQNARARRLAAPARPAEQVGMVDPSRAQRLHERPRDVLLPDDLLEGRRAITPIERRHAASSGRFTRECHGTRP